MSHIEDLIKSLCPDGVPFEPLSGIGDWYGGGTPSKARPDYWVDGTIPWVSPKDMGLPIIDATEDYITEAAIKGSATKLVPPTSIAMVVRSSILDRIFPTALVPVPVALNQDMKAVVPRDDILPAYLAHVLRSYGPAILRFARKAGGSVTSIESNKLSSFRIPAPPVEVQREIVRVLDLFGGMTAELTTQLDAELQARQRQYTYHCDRLFAFPQAEGVDRIPIGELGKIFRGKRFTKADYVPEGGVACIHYGEIYTDYGTAATHTVSRVRADLAQNLRFAHRGDVVLTDVGETVEDVGKAVAWLGDEDAAIHDHCYVIRSPVNPIYLSYYMQTAAFRADKDRHVARTKVKTLLLDGLKQIEVPVPSQDDQERIVSILDKYKAPIADLTVALPAEINARRKQYEYYCNRLLTFEELMA